MNTSCDHLLVFCVKYNTILPPTRFINLVIANDSSADYVFLGEVTFLDGASNEPCYIPPRSGKNANSHIICNYHALDVIDH